MLVDLKSRIACPVLLVVNVGTFVAVFSFMTNAPYSGSLACWFLALLLMFAMCYVALHRWTNKEYGKQHLFLFCVLNAPLVAYLVRYVWYRFAEFRSVNVLLAIFITIVVFTTLILWVLTRQSRYWICVAALLASGILVIGLFAEAYRFLGIRFADPEARSYSTSVAERDSEYSPPSYRGYVDKPDWRDSLYFSLITFTTLGYGDIHPLPETRLVAGVEAALGYLYMGLLVAYLMTALSSTPGQREHNPARR